MLTWKCVCGDNKLNNQNSQPCAQINLFGFLFGLNPLEIDLQPAKNSTTPIAWKCCSWQGDGYWRIFYNLEKVTLKTSWVQTSFHVLWFFYGELGNPKSEGIPKNIQQQRSLNQVTTVGAVMLCATMCKRHRIEKGKPPMSKSFNLGGVVGAPWH